MNTFNPTSYKAFMNIIDENEDLKKELSLKDQKSDDELDQKDQKEDDSKKKWKCESHKIKKKKAENRTQG